MIATKNAPTRSRKDYAFDHRILAIHTLRVNVKSLAAEARIIRLEEKRCGILYRDSLRYHRTEVVRKESRIAMLALAFVRGKKYRDVENGISKWIDMSRLIKKINSHWHAAPDDVLKWIKSL